MDNNKKIIQQLRDKLEVEYNLNRHRIGNSDAIEFEVKNLQYPSYSEVKKYFPKREYYEEFIESIYDMPVIDNYANKCLEEVNQKTGRFFGGYKFVGRMSGWLALEFELMQDDEFDTDKQIIIYLQKILKKCEIAKQVIAKYKSGFKNYILKYIKDNIIINNEDMIESKIRKEIRNIIKEELKNGLLNK